MAEWKQGKELPKGYIVQKYLGGGGFGDTYLATTKKSQKVVIKRHNPKEKNIDHAYYRDNFYNEALRMAKLDSHPYIVKIIEFLGDVDEMPCIVMEYINGQSLSDLIEQKPLHPCEALVYILQIASALIHIHKKGWVHRDVKPDNIIIRDGENRKKEAILIDFGNARLFNNEENSKNTAFLTMCYAPIEQFDPDEIEKDYSDR